MTEAGYKLQQDTPSTKSLESPTKIHIREMQRDTKQQQWDATDTQVNYRSTKQLKLAIKTLKTIAKLHKLNHKNIKVGYEKWIKYTTRIHIPAATKSI